MKKEEIIFRQATQKDIGQMLTLINENADAGKMLHKNKK